jgi:hypothetical protein
MKKLIFAIGIAALMSGCYIGKAAFQGEDMKIYPFFGPSAGTTCESRVCETATQPNTDGQL